MKQHSFTELQKYFNEALTNLEIEGSPKELYAPIRYSLQMGGKRFRPALVLMGCELFNGDYSKAMPQAIAIELFHNFTLIHDDIMDAALLRRGSSTVFNKFGTPSAILSGDAMLVLAGQYMMQCDSSIQHIVLQTFNECAIKVCEGQQADMNFESNEEVSVVQYINMIESKTAALIAASLKIGALCGGASVTEAKELYEFGKHCGISFQLKDDWLDVYGDAEKFGKQLGGDILRNKKTFLFLKALELASEKEKTVLKKWYSNSEDEKRKVADVIRIFDETRVSDSLKSEMNNHFSNSLTSLRKLKKEENQSAPLLELAGQFLDREH